MLYVVFVIFALLYNIRKFFREKSILLSSLNQASSESHRHMILGHWFYIFIFETFLGIIVAHLISERGLELELFEIGLIYIVILFVGLLLFQIFIRHLEKLSSLELKKLFNQHLLRELRVSFTLILLPIILYSVISWAFQDSYEEWGKFWLVGVLANILFVSVLTISCTVVIMLHLIPNREITEPEYLETINKHLTSINVKGMRLRWIETDIKNAFVVGLKLFRFSNQTMFVGKKMRDILSIEEFDAVIAHEVAHVANRHIVKRIIELVKNFVSLFIGFLLIVPLVFIISYLTLGDDVDLYTSNIASITIFLCMFWFVINHAIFFDTIRSHEYEADAFAVINLGIPFSTLKTTLEKLTGTEDLPEYLKKKAKPKSVKKKNNWLIQVFSTHPSIEERLKFLKFKIDRGLPFNYYVSPVMKIRTNISKIFEPKFLAPIMSFLIAYVAWVSFSIKEGDRMVKLIRDSNPEMIMKDTGILSSINSRPYFVGKSLMFHIVQKKDPALIDFFLSKGANPGRTLLYVTELRDSALFEKYFTTLDRDLSQDEFYLVLRRSAMFNFTGAHRLLVNSSRFEHLDTEKREEIVKIGQNKFKDRSPASIKK